jgi:hypothetical protein
MRRDGAPRLYTRVDIGLRVILDDREYSATNWSLGGLALANSAPFGPVGATVPGQIKINAEGVDVAIAVRLRIVHKQADRVGFAFAGLSPDQIGVLRSLILRHGVAPLERMPEPAAAATAGGRLLEDQLGRRRTGRTWRAAMILWLLAFASVPVFMAAKTAIAPAADRSVFAAAALPAETIAAADRGYVDHVLVKPGEALTVGQRILTFRLRAAPSTVSAVTSPCVCRVLATVVTPGAEIAPGDTVAHVTLASDDDVVIEALFPADAAVAEGTPVEIVAEHRQQPLVGVVAAVHPHAPDASLFGLPAFLRDDNRYAYVLIRASEPAMTVSAGTPAAVRLTSR